MSHHFPPLNHLSRKALTLAALLALTSAVLLASPLTAQGQPASPTRAASGWAAQTSGVTETLWDVACADATHAWAVGDYGTILATTDGGASWTKQGQVGMAKTFWSVACADATHAWAVGDSAILSTTDGGATWNKQTLGIGLLPHAVACANTTHAWAVGLSGTIVATTNGSTWRAQTSKTDERLHAVTCADENTAWAVGGSGTILKTSDGGENWVQQNSKTMRDLRDVTCSDSSHAWAVGWDGTIVATTDGGATWNSQAPPATPSAAWISAVACSDSTHVWSAALGDILATTDGGTSWSVQASSPRGTLFAIACADATHAWAVGNDGTIFATKTGGKLPDTKPPSTIVTGADNAWHATPVTLTFTPEDNYGGSGMVGGLAKTEYKVDTGDWTTGTVCTVAAPADHSADGPHTILYRSTDAAGNTEAERRVLVRIDTTAPLVFSKLATGKPTKPIKLFYRVTDNLSNQAKSVVLTVRNRKNQPVRIYRLATAPTNSWHAVIWSTKTKGNFTYTVTASDSAGNVQTVASSARIVVK